MFVRPFAPGLGVYWVSSILEPPRHATPSNVVRPPLFSHEGVSLSSRCERYVFRGDRLCRATVAQLRSRKGNDGLVLLDKE